MTEHTTDPLADISDRLAAIETALGDMVEHLGRPAQRWLTIAQAAEYAGLSVESMRRLLAAGRMTTHRPTPGRIAVDRLALDQYMLGATRCPRVRRGTAAADAARRRAGA